MKWLNKLLIWLLLLAPVAYLAIIWSKLPDQVPMHYNIEGEADRYGNKSELWVPVLILFVVNIVVYFLLTNIHYLDPKKKYKETSLKQMRRLAFIIVLFSSVLGIYIIYTSQQAAGMINGSFVLAATGALFVVLGNYMYSSKPNYFFGIRLPWALESEANWIYTHRLAGKLWFAGGLLIIPVSLLLPASVSMIIFFVIIAIITGVPMIASFLFFKKPQKKQ